MVFVTQRTQALVAGRNDTSESFLFHDGELRGAHALMTAAMNVVEESRSCKHRVGERKREGSMSRDFDV